MSDLRTASAKLNERSLTGAAAINLSGAQSGTETSGEESFATCSLHPERL